MDDRRRWNARYAAGRGPSETNARLRQFSARLKPGRVLDLAGGLGANARLFAASRVVLVDISDVALTRAAGMRVQADASALPFAAHAFDSIVCTYFFEPRVDYAFLLTPGGTLFFETYTRADAKYQTNFNPAYYLDPALLPQLFAGLTIEHWQEHDDGQRVFGTLLARKP